MIINLKIKHSHFSIRTDDSKGQECETLAVSSSDEKCSLGTLNVHSRL